MSTQHLCPTAQESMRSPKHIRVPQTLIAPLPHLQESLGIAPWLAQSIECHSSLSPMPQSPGTREGRGLQTPPISFLSHYPQPGPDPPLSPACNSGLAILSASTLAPKPIFPCEPGELPEAPTTAGLLSYLNLPWLPSAPSIKSPAWHDLACFPLRPPASSVSAPALPSLTEALILPTFTLLLLMFLLPTTSSPPHPC